MQKQAPSIFQLVTIAGFALSCFGILLYLWVVFGGPVPLAAQGYNVKIPFTEAQLLAKQSDVRISGVSVGKVTAIELGDGGRAIATLELNNKYAPLPSDTKAILRQKTLLGETYVELTPGDGDDPGLEDGSTLPVAQVSDAVQLDEVFRTFDQETRDAFQVWQRDVAVALKGRGDDLSYAFALLEPTFSSANEVLRTLDTQRLAVRQLIRNTGIVFDALSERQGQLRGLIQNTERVFSTTATRNQDLQDLFVVLPTFLDESTATLERLDRFAANTDPLVQQLRPAVRELSPVLIKSGRLAPELQGFFVGLRPVIAAAPSGFPALRRFLRVDFPPLLRRIQPFLRELNPLLQALVIYRHEIAAFLGNAAAATNGLGISPETSSRGVKYLRTAVPLGPDSLAAYPRRLLYNRTNPYQKPLGSLTLGSDGHLKSFETRQCSGGINAILRDWSELTPAEQANFEASLNGPVTGEPPPPGFAEDLYNRLKEFAYKNERNSNDLPQPACVAQGTFAPLGQPNRPSQKYQQVYRER
jgi:phospholipid/cholesterol/gamma-HCH transport system substrate-binding protein